MKNQTSRSVLFVSTRAFAKKTFGRLLRQRSADPQKKAVLLIYIKGISVGIACLLILVFPLFYFSIHATPTAVAVAGGHALPKEIKWKHITAEHWRVLTLPDGSRVTLSEGSTFSYPENFNQLERKARSSGVAYFEIKHSETKPFEITTATAVIRDLGTAFLLRSTDTLQEVSVTEGKVYLTSRVDYQKSITVLPGQTGVVMGSNLYKKTTKVRNQLAEYTHVLQFQNTPLAEVAADLSDYYRTPVSIAPSLEKRNIEITAQFRKLSLEEVMLLLQREHNLVVKKNGSGYLLMRESFVKRIIRQFN